MQYIYGLQSVLNLIASQQKIKKLFLTHHRYQQLQNKIAVSFQICDYKDLTQLVKTPKHQGIIALIDDIKFHDFKTIVSQYQKKQNAFFVILNHITDVGNLGNILRTCCYFGVDGVIFSKDKQAPLANSYVFKVASGSFGLLKLIQVVNVNNAIIHLKKQEFWTVGQSLDKKAKDIRKIDWKTFSHLALVVGNENKGVQKNIQNNCDFLVKINASQSHELHLLDSLNVSTALGISLYEML